MFRDLAVGLLRRYTHEWLLTLAAAAAGNDDLPDGPSGSGALAASSEADPWVRTNGPWNPPDNTSPTLHSHSGSTSPTRTRGSIPNIAPQTVLEIQNPYSQARPAIGQGATFSRSQPKSNLDPLSGSFKYVRKPSYAYNDDKENSTQYLSNGDSYDIDIPPRYRAIGNNASRDGSMPPSRLSDAGLSGSNMPFGSSNTQFGSIGHHTPSSSIHSQRPSISGASTFPSQMNGARYEINQNEAELNEKFAGLGLNREEQSSASSQINNNFTSYSPINTSFPPQNYPFNGASGMWNTEAKGLSNFEAYANQSFADQGYFNRPARFTERSSVSPAGSDYRRGLGSPKYYPSTGTPPSGSDQAYRPVSRGARIPQGPSELAARMQSIHFSQQAQFMYANQFPAQFVPQGYEYQAPVFRQGAGPYGYTMAMPVYAAPQGIPTRPAKDQDVGVGVRSVLLEEFRSNGKGNKRYELKVG
jgi:mRNA-binding protein PUF3